MRLWVKGNDALRYQMHFDIKCTSWENEIVLLGASYSRNHFTSIYGK